MSNQTITLIPLAMRQPTKQGIYTLSLLQDNKTILASQLADYNSRAILVSFAFDGVSNPKMIAAYGLGLDCWWTTAADIAEAR